MLETFYQFHRRRDLRQLFVKLLPPSLVDSDGHRWKEGRNLCRWYPSCDFTQQRTVRKEDAPQNGMWFSDFWSCHQDYDRVTPFHELRVAELRIDSDAIVLSNISGYSCQDFCCHRMWTMAELKSEDPTNYQHVVTMMLEHWCPIILPQLLATGEAVTDDMMRAAVMRDHTNIKYFDPQPEWLQLLSIECGAADLTHIREPTYGVYLLAVKRRPLILLELPLNVWTDELVCLAVQLADDPLMIVQRVPIHFRSQNMYRTMVGRRAALLYMVPQDYVTLQMCLNAYRRNVDVLCMVPEPLRLHVQYSYHKSYDLAR